MKTPAVISLLLSALAIVLTSFSIAIFVECRTVTNADQMNQTSTGTCNQADKTDSDTEWLSKVMKRVTVANTIDDIKSVCCDLIAKVAELTNRSLVTNNKSDQAVMESQSIKQDLTRLTRYFDREIEEIRNEVISNEEYITKEDFDKMNFKVDDLESRSRRNNLRIRNVVQGAKNGFDDPASMKKFVSMVIKDSFKRGISLDESAIQRAHRVGPKSPE